MMWNYGYGLNTYNTLWGNPFSGLVMGILIPLVAWSLVWKGWALWKAAKNDSKPWFIALLIVNTMGILDILYIFVFGKQKKTSKRK